MIYRGPFITLCECGESRHLYPGSKTLLALLISSCDVMPLLLAGLRDGEPRRGLEGPNSSRLCRYDWEYMAAMTE